MHTRLQTTTTTRCYPNPKVRASTRNLLGNEDREAEQHRHKTQKPSGKLSRRRDRSTRVISSKDFVYPRVLVKSKHQLTNARKPGKSSENPVKRKKLAIHKTKGEDLEKNTIDRHKVRATPSNLKAARTFVLCSIPTKHRLVRQKRRNTKAPSQQLELLRLYPQSKEYVEPNYSSDVFSTAGESLLSTSIPQKHPLYRSAECAVVNAPPPKLINTKRELNARIVSDRKLPLEHNNLATIVAAGDTNLRVERTDPPVANVVKKLTTNSLMSPGGLKVQSALKATTDNSKATTAKVPTDLAEVIAKVLVSHSPQDHSSYSHAASINSSTTQTETPQLTVTEHSYAQAIHRDQPENDSVGSLKFDRRDSSIETQMTALMKDKNYSKMPEKQVSTMKEAKRCSREQPLCQPGIAAKSLDNTMEKILKPVRTPRGISNNTIQSKSTSRRKSHRSSSNEVLPAWKPGGATKISSMNLTKSSELKENVPQSPNTRERRPSQQGQTKSLARRQKTSSCEIEKDSTHLSSKSFTVTDTRMMKIYNCLAVANLGRRCKDVTDQSTSTKSKNSPPETDNDSTPHSTVDLLKKSSNNSPQSKEANGILDVLENQPRESLRSSINLDHCGNNSRDVKCGDEEEVVMDSGSIASAIKYHETITHSRRQLPTVHTDSIQSHPQCIETARNDLKKMREPQLNNSEPIQKSGYRPMKKSMAFVKQGKPRKSINTCTISLNILKQFFYRQGISADLIDRAERDLRRRYGGDGRSIMNVDRLDPFVDKIDKSCETPPKPEDVLNAESIETEEITTAKELKDPDVTDTLTHAEKPTGAGTQSTNLRQLCADLQLRLEQGFLRDSTKVVNTETQTLQSFMSVQDIGTECDEEPVIEIQKTDACIETVKVRSVSVSTNTEDTDHQSSSDTSMHNDHSSIINENLLAERVFESSSNNTIGSAVSSNCSTGTLENPQIILKLYEPAIDSGKKIEHRRRSTGTSTNPRKNIDEGHAKKLPRTVSKIRGFPRAPSKIFRRRRDHFYSKRTKCNALSPCTSNYDTCSSKETDSFQKPDASLTKKSSSSITLPEVISLMEILLRKISTTNADDTNSQRENTPSTSNCLILRQSSYDSQLIIADKSTEQSFSSFSAVWRACLLSIVYGSVCLFVFSCLQFSITCDFGSSHRFP